MEKQDIEYVIEAHTRHAKKPSKAFRKWDGQTPYWIHPMWCATMIASETKLDKKTREEGSLVLLYHDILEDTTASLPTHLEPRICEMVKQMTFPGGSAEEQAKIWGMPEHIKLYKLYDKVHNLIDGAWMSSEKKAAYTGYLQKLSTIVMRQYPNVELNILRSARWLDLGLAVSARDDNLK